MNDYEIIILVSYMLMIFIILHFKLSWLGCLNFFILQWFFIRLARIEEIIDFELTHINIMPENKIGIGGSAKSKNKYKIIKWILPLTGWKNDFIYLNKKKIK